MYFVYYIWYFKKNVNQYLKEGKLYTLKKSRFLSLLEKSGVLVNPHFHRAAFRENKADAVESCLDGDLLLLHCSHNHSYFITNIKAICNRQILLRKVRFFSRVTEWEYIIFFLLVCLVLWSYLPGKTDCIWLYDAALNLWHCSISTCEEINWVNFLQDNRQLVLRPNGGALKVSHAKSTLLAKFMPHEYDSFHISNISSICYIIKKLPKWIRWLITCCMCPLVNYM